MDPVIPHIAGKLLWLAVRSRAATVPIKRTKRMIWKILYLSMKAMTRKLKLCAPRMAPNTNEAVIIAPSLAVYQNRVQNWGSLSTRKKNEAHMMANGCDWKKMAKKVGPSLLYKLRRDLTLPIALPRCLGATLSLMMLSSKS